MGDAVNMLLTPPYILDQVEVVKNPNEYLSAIRDGRVWDNCSAYTGKCGRSFYKVRKVAFSLFAHCTTQPRSCTG